MSELLTWTNTLRALAIIVLIGLLVFDFGLDAFAKELPKELYIGLVAVALGVDIKALRGVFLRLIGGGEKPKDE